jgi:hypothetical protein
LAAAEREAALLGERLLTRVVRQCYPISGQREEAITIEFQREHDAARVNAALAFGAMAAAVLVPREHSSERPMCPVELLCAMFNLGIGLVDGLCDEDPDTGGRLLVLLHGRDLVEAAEETPTRGWLGAKLPPRLAMDLGVAFTVDVIEAFFLTLHAVYPDDEWLPLRRRVGTQLTVALEAERQSVGAWPVRTSREQLIECSRCTSVLPFEIIQTLAGGDIAPTEPSAGTLLGEAMWRIDDLVDLCQDTRRGALNGLLLAATDEPGRPEGELGLLAVLERLLRSTDIARGAAEAAESLLAGLQLAGSGRATAQDHVLFLHFIQRYAGITSSERS